MKKRIIRAVLAVLVAISPAMVAAEGCPENAAADLAGALCARGIALQATHKSDVFSNRSGGVATGSAWLMNTELALDINLDKLVGWNGASVFLQYHAQHGDTSINDYTGSFAGVSNIETGLGKSQWFQAWLQQELDDGRYSILAGLYAIDSEFYVTESSGLFLQPPYGMAAEMAQSGSAGPPVFPAGALGLRVKYRTDNFYLQAAFTDGVPGFNPVYGGRFAVAEFGFTPSAAADTLDKTALGIWGYSADAQDLSETDSGGNLLPRADRGLYLLGEATLLAEPGNPGQGLAWFWRIGAANKHVYQADWSGSVGLNYAGLFDGRDEDECGVAMTVSHAGEKYRLLNAAQSAETVFELTYRARLLPWLAVQPDLQFIRHPNMDAQLQDAWLIGTRIEVGL